jgi:CspA family cold shock protein
MLDKSLKLWYLAVRCDGVRLHYSRCTERAKGVGWLEPEVYQQGGTKTMEDNGRSTGTVQWFSRVKGYGFIRPDGQEEDVFVHYSAIRGEGYRNLNEGQRVEFTMEDTPKGPQAVDVIGLETAGTYAVESEPEAIYTE